LGFFCIARFYSKECQIIFLNYIFFCLVYWFIFKWINDSMLPDIIFPSSLSSSLEPIVTWLILFLNNFFHERPISAVFQDFLFVWDYLHQPLFFNFILIELQFLLLWTLQSLLNCLLNCFGELWGQYNIFFLKNCVIILNS
jgi:hypothetical protein